LEFSISTTTLANQKTLVAQVSVSGENAKLTSEKVYLEKTSEGVNFSIEKKPENVSEIDFLNGFICGVKN